MTKNLRVAIFAVTAVFGSFFTSSCVSPYNTSVGGSYSSGYGGGGYDDGYGGGGSSVSTSLFVSTGNPRWGYDPSLHSYYDYSRRSYYDPYLYGYYPVGYRPSVVYGVPHPYGYSRSYCPPPSRYRDSKLSNYRSRDVAYQNSGYDWAPRVRGSSSRSSEDRDGRGDKNYFYGGAQRTSRSDLRLPDVAPSRGFDRGGSRSFRSSREAGLPSSYNTPARIVQRDFNQGGRRTQLRQPADFRQQRESFAPRNSGARGRNFENQAREGRVRQRAEGNGGGGGGRKSESRSERKRDKEDN